MAGRCSAQLDIIIIIIIVVVVVIIIITITIIIIIILLLLPAAATVAVCRQGVVSVIVIRNSHPRRQVSAGPSVRCHRHHPY